MMKESSSFCNIVVASVLSDEYLNVQWEEENYKPN